MVDEQGPRFQFPSPDPDVSFPTRRLYGRISRVDELSETAHRRLSIEFDGIDADDTDKKGVQILKVFSEVETLPFALLRMVTTSRKFEEIAGAPPVVGDWFLLDISGEGIEGIPTWHSQLVAAGYLDFSKGLTVSGTRLQFPGREPTEPPPRSLGAGAVARHVPQVIAEICDLTNLASDEEALVNLVADLPAPTAVVVHDVGQANFVSLQNEHGNVIAYFDVGFPVSWNNRTRPKDFVVPIGQNAIVILSHWDWDHFHAAFSLQHLQDGPWIVPNQTVGPGAARLAQILLSKGNLLVWSGNPSLDGSPLELFRTSTSPVISNNNSGIIAYVRLSSGNQVLLTGDADYDCLPISIETDRASIDHLVVTHHGARLHPDATWIPQPVDASGTAIVSYGTKNVYRHPHSETRESHLHGNWSWKPTAGVYGGDPRGNRTLT